MTNQQARDESVNLLLGGSETMATALTWLCYLLAKHPEIQEQVYNEIKSTLGNRDFIIEGLSNLNLLKMSFQEALRLYPPVYLLSRESLKPIELNDQIHILLFVLQRNKKLFENPDQFRPERFSEENKHKIRPNTYIPFGLGPRSCVGERFGHMATLLKKFKLVGTQEAEIEAKVALYPKNGLQLKIVPRIDPS